MTNRAEKVKELSEKNWNNKKTDDSKNSGNGKRKLSKTNKQEYNKNKNSPGRDFKFKDTRKKPKSKSSQDGKQIRSVETVSQGIQTETSFQFQLDCIFKNNYTWTNNQSSSVKSFSIDSQYEQNMSTPRRNDSNISPFATPKSSYADSNASPKHEIGMISDIDEEEDALRTTDLEIMKDLSLESSFEEELFRVANELNELCEERKDGLHNQSGPLQTNDPQWSAIPTCCYKK